MSHSESVLMVNAFDVFTTELCSLFDAINTLRLKYGMGHISRGEYRQQYGALCRKAHRIMGGWERAGIEEAILE